MNVTIVSPYLNPKTLVFLTSKKWAHRFHSIQTLDVGNTLPFSLIRSTINTPLHNTTKKQSNGLIYLTQLMSHFLFPFRNPQGV